VQNIFVEYCIDNNINLLILTEFYRRSAVVHYITTLADIINIYESYSDVCDVVCCNESKVLIYVPLLYLLASCQTCVYKIFLSNI